MALTKAQKEMRRTAYGASEIAALVGLSPYSTPLSVYESKVLGPPPEEVDDNLAARLGDLLEKPVADVYAERKKKFLRPVHTLRHPNKVLAIATPDFAVFGHNPLQKGKLRTLDRLDVERLLQVKTRSMRAVRYWGPEGTDNVAEDTITQVTWEMGVTGLPTCDVAVLFRGDFGLQFRIYTVEFDAELFGNLYTIVERFHVDHVLSLKPPPEEERLEIYERFLKRRYPKVLRPHLVTSEALDTLILRWAKLKEVSKRVEKLLEADTLALREAIGEHEGLISQRYGTLNFRGKQPSEVVDWQKAYREAAALAGHVLNVAQLPEGIDRAALVAQLQAILPANTTTKDNGRWFQNKLSGEASFELQKLNIGLDALKKKTTTPADDEASPTPTGEAANG